MRIPLAVRAETPACSRAPPLAQGLAWASRSPSPTACLSSRAKAASVAARRRRHGSQHTSSVALAVAMPKPISQPKTKAVDPRRGTASDREPGIWRGTAVRRETRTRATIDAEDNSATARDQCRGNSAEIYKDRGIGGGASGTAAESLGRRTGMWGYRWPCGPRRSNAASPAAHSRGGLAVAAPAAGGLLVHARQGGIRGSQAAEAWAGTESGSPAHRAVAYQRSQESSTTSSA